MKKLHITSNGVSLPLEAVTQTFAILAVKGSGKSYTASVVAEEMLKLNQQIVVLDLTGAWYGLKSSADGKADGFPIAIFGGDHADVPLQEHAGEIIAQAIVEKRFSVILDLSLFRKGQVVRFLGTFLETLYRLNREPLHLFADEADAYCPQKVHGDQARTVGAMEDIVRRGRKKGIGCTLITQRPASLNKDVLTQCEVLVGLRMIHPRDIDAIKEWVNVHSTIEQARDMISSLPSLPTGTAWLWSPSWLQVFERVTIRKRDTFDSGATPKPGEQVRVPKKQAFIDIKKLGEEIEQTVEKAKADDPAALKKRIRDLIQQSEITAKDIERLKGSVKTETKVKEIPVISDKQIDRIEKLIDRAAVEYSGVIVSLEEKWKTLYDLIMPVSTYIDRMKQVQQERDPRPLPAMVRKYPMTENEAFRGSAKGPKDLALHPANKDNKIGGPERKILAALGPYHPQSRTKVQIAMLAGYAHNGGSFNNALGKCRSNGLIEGHGDSITITPEGMKFGPFPRLPEGEELRRYWYGKLGKAERMILVELCGMYPKSLTKDQIGTMTGYEPNGGSFNNAIGRLRTLELIEGRGDIKASSNLFE